MDHPQPSPASDHPSASAASVNSLRELVDLMTGRNTRSNAPASESILNDLPPYPFLAIVGQTEMKMALLLALINPLIGGVLLIGPRGTGKTTSIRGLASLMPDHEVSNCRYGCLPEDIQTSGMDGICPDCARKFGEGQPISRMDRTQIIEIPLNAQLTDVIGRIDEITPSSERPMIKKGLLAHANRNLLYIDEVNLLNTDLVDAILDAAAVGAYSIKSNTVNATVKSRFTLVGSMNPDEGALRPQLMDRFGLRVIVRGLESENERLQAYQCAGAYRRNPISFNNQFLSSSLVAIQEIQKAQKILPTVSISEELARSAIRLIHSLGIDSLRAEITLLEAARALAASENRYHVELDDIKYVAPMALRMRRLSVSEAFYQQIKSENENISALLE